MSKSKRLKPRPAVRFDAAAIASGKAKVPAAALRFEADVDINDAGGDGNIPVTVRARSGNVLKHWYWGAIVHDFAGMRAASAQLPFDYCHREDEVLGYSDQQDVSSGELVMTGVLIPFKAEDRVDEITHKSANGFQYQASIYFDPDELILEYVPEGFTAAVNDGQVEGPCIIARQWMLRGAALCPYGKDPNTSAQFSASQPGDEVAVCFQEPGSQEPSAMTTKKTKLSAAKPNRHERRKAAALSAKKGKAKTKLTTKPITKPAGRAKTKFEADDEEDEEDAEGGDDEDDEEELDADDEEGEQDADDEEGEEDADGDSDEDDEEEDDEDGDDPAEMDADEEKCKQSAKGGRGKGAKLAAKPVKAGKATIKTKLSTKPNKAAADVKKFITAFGPQGGVWFSEGKSFNEATALFTAELQKENTQLQKKVASQAAQLAAARGDDPASFGSAEEPAGKGATKPMNGLSDAQAKFAASLKVPKA